MNLGAKPSSERPEFTFYVNEEREERRRQSINSFYEGYMTSSKPYLIRAIYEWIADNGCTPYISVDATFPGTDVPKQYIVDNTITLDISSEATHQLLIDNEAVTFKARFGGVGHDLYIPISAVVAIYAQENTQGMEFPYEEHENYLDETEQADLPEAIPAKTGKLQLKVISGGKEQ